tara:strand:+ start:118671 stop:118946 length:276 start_codon:yes stop_codon:yes gene_type:complete
MLFDQLLIQYAIALLTVRHCQFIESAQSDMLQPILRRGGRAVECNGLENRRAFTGTVGSNPTLSAIPSGSDQMSKKPYRPNSLKDAGLCSQ